MTFEEMVTLVANNGIGICCIVYFMFRDYHFMQKISDLLASLNSVLEDLKDEHDRLAS